jgi:hypothetical protein
VRYIKVWLRVFFFSVILRDNLAIPYVSGCVLFTFNVYSVDKLPTCLDAAGKQKKIKNTSAKRIFFGSQK